MKYMIVMSYDGSKFYGFQRQNNMRNVQGYIEETLSKILDEKIEIKGAGRTDRGVHAKYQVAHFITNKDIKGLKRKLNKLLKDIKIKKIKKVPDNFHARHSVKEKTYLYKLALDKNYDDKYFGIEVNKLDIKKMKEVSKVYIGTHDFKNFVSGERLDYNSTIIDIKIKKKGNVIYFKFIGIGFYRYMVRNLVGAIISVGKNKAKIEEVKDMLNGKSEKRLPTSSPNGLYLLKIKY